MSWVDWEKIRKKQVKYNKGDLVVIVNCQTTVRNMRQYLDTVQQISDYMITDEQEWYNLKDLPYFWKGDWLVPYNPVEINIEDDNIMSLFGE